MGTATVLPWRLTQPRPCLRGFRPLTSGQAQGGALLSCVSARPRKTGVRPALRVWPFIGRCSRLLRPRLTPAAPSRRLAAAVAHPLPGAERQVSQGNARDLHAMCPSHLRPHLPGDIGLWTSRRPRPDACASYAPPFGCLFVGPALCLQLSSGPASRRVSYPCCSANGSHHQGP